MSIVTQIFDFSRIIENVVSKSSSVTNHQKIEIGEKAKDIRVRK